MNSHQSKQFEQTYLNLVDDVYRYVYFKLQNQPEAEDATAETFLRLVNQRDLDKVADLQIETLHTAHQVIYQIYRQQSKLVSVSANVVDQPELLSVPATGNHSIDAAKLNSALAKLNEL